MSLLANHGEGLAEAVGVSPRHTRLLKEAYRLGDRVELYGKISPFATVLGAVFILARLREAFVEGPGLDRIDFLYFIAIIVALVLFRQVRLSTEARWESSLKEIHELLEANGRDSSLRQGRDLAQASPRE